jgi:phage major head subunit gpT-like protein
MSKLMDLQLFAVIEPTTVNTIVHNTGDAKTNFGKLLEPGLRKIFFESYNELPEQFPKIYNMETSTKAEETDFGMGAFGDWTKRATSLDKVAYQKLSAGKERKYKHDSFTSGFMVERELYDDDQYRQLAKMPSALGRACRASVEKDAISILEKGFTVNGYDGVPLFSNLHPLVDNASIKGKNLVYGTLTRDTLKEAIKVMREAVDEAGNLMQLKPDTLIIPPALEDTALRILESNLLPGGNSNDTNEYITSKNMKILVMDYLGATAGGSDTAWFLQDSKRHQLNFFWRTKPEFKWDEDFDTFVAKYRGYMRYSYGYSDFRGIVGSDGVTVQP